MTRTPCRTIGCTRYTRTGLRASAGFPEADGEYCWHCRREQRRDPKDRNVSFFLVGQHDIPDPPPTPEQAEADLRAAWGPEAMKARDAGRAAMEMSDEEFARLRGL